MSDPERVASPWPAAQTQVQAQAKLLCDLGRQLIDRGLAAGSAGNLSSRLWDDWIAVTPSGRSLARLSPDELVLVDAEGRPHERTPSGLAPTSELAVHLAMYQADSQIKAVVHAHPRAVTALSLLGPPWPNLCVSAEGAAAFGPVCVVPYLRPGTSALGASCLRAANTGSRALVLLHHGAVTAASSLEQALAMMESLEHVCQLWALAAQLGPRPATLPEDEARALRAQYGHDPSLPLAWYDAPGSG